MVFNGSESDEEVRTVLDAVHSPIVDAWREVVRTIPTTRLLAFLIDADRAHNMLKTEEPGPRATSEEDNAHERRVFACVLAASDEIDRRIPVLP